MLHLEMLRKSLAAFSVLLFTSKGSALVEEFRVASVVDQLVLELRANPMTNSFRETVLGTARAEDRIYVRDMIAAWKPLPRKRITERFDTLILRDAAGGELLRMNLLGDKIWIDDYPWSIPNAGSIVESLESHFKNRSEVSRFSPLTLISSVAYAAKPATPRLSKRDPRLLVAYSYAVGTSKTVTPGGYVEANSPKDYLRSSTSYVPEWLRKKLGLKTKIRCEGTSSINSSAEGTVEYAGARMGFKSLPDGTVILKLSDGSILRVKSQTDQNGLASAREKVLPVKLHEQLLVQKCTDPTCSKFESPLLGESILPFLDQDPTAGSRSTRRHFIPEVNRALSYRSGQSRKALAEIVQIGTVDSPHFQVVGRPPSPDALELAKAASDALQARRDQVDGPTRSLRPLGQCCGDPECRKLLDTEPAKGSTLSPKGTKI